MNGEEESGSNETVGTLGFGLACYLVWLEFVNSLISLSPFTLLDVLDFPLFDILDEFQWKLCKILVFIVLINIALICIFWHIYGNQIVDKFMQPTSSARLIEELKHSISELKLPKEHSPRI